MILRMTRMPRLLLLSLVAVQAFAQAPVPPPPPPPDLVVFTNGEQLTGVLERADGGGITFKSAMAGEITVAWANIKQLTSTSHFAVITKGEQLRRTNAVAIVPQGTVQVNDKQIVLTGPRGQQTVDVPVVNQFINAADFDRAVNHPPNVLHGWGGTVTGGAGLVRSTQDITTFNGAVTLARSTPTVNWLPPHDRSLLNYTQTYGTTSQVGTPTIENNIFHANGEYDRYFSPRLYSFASGTFDHNFASDLDLEQAYGGGVGITVIKNALQEFDFKGDAHYEKQTFFNNALNPTATTQNQNLFGSTFSETYIRHITKKGLVLNEFGSISPSWSQSNSSPTQPNAYSAHANASLIFPVYKGFAFNVGAVDDYINNAPTGSKKNSTQYTTGITYVIKPR